MKKSRRRKQIQEGNTIKVIEGSNRGGDNSIPRLSRQGRTWVASLALSLAMVVMVLRRPSYSVAKMKHSPSHVRSNVRNDPFLEEDPQPSRQPAGVTFLSRARPDRAGGALLDMLLCHAFAFQEHVAYGGACVETTMLNQSFFIYQHIEEQKNLIRWLGLQEELPFACPKDRSGMLLNRHDYFAHDTKIFTEGWLSKIRSKVTKQLKLAPSHHETLLQVAVHVRRGDVTPCSEPERYLPNSYYLALVDQYVRAPAMVTIYSEETEAGSLEQAWGDFTERGYTLQLGTDLEQVWEAFVKADVLILSKSSFSFVPALFNQNTIVYTPFWHKPLLEWNVVSQNIVAAHLKESKSNCF